MPTINPQRIDVTPKLDPRLFAVFSLANVAGYNADNGWEFGHVRRDVRCRLAGSAERWRAALEDAGMLAYVQRGGARLLDWTPQLGPPPEFAPLERLEYRVGWQAGSRTAIEGLERILAGFVREEGILDLWAEFEPVYEVEANLLMAGHDRLVRIAERFEDPATEHAVTVALAPNLLDARGRGYSLSTASRSWLFFGPMHNARQAEEVAVHELLHRWIDDACERRWKTEEGPDPMPLAKARHRMVAEMYPEFQIWAAETIVRAMTIWLVPDLEYQEEPGGAVLLEYYERIGFTGITAVHELLQQTAGQPMAGVIEEAISMVRQRIWEEAR